MDGVDEELHEEVHRLMDNLGKYSAIMVFTPPKPIGPNELQEFCRRILTEVAVRCKEDGMDVIGHIKSFVKTEHGWMSLSLIDLNKGVNIINMIEDDNILTFDMNLHVIVHGIWDPIAQECTQKAISGICADSGFIYSITQDFVGVEDDD